jgi:hypothetical protein
MFIPGKVPYIKKAVLNISVSSGIMIEQAEWVPNTHHYTRFNELYPAPYSDLKIQIEFNGESLISSSLDSVINIEKLFEDSEEITQHTIKIKLSGIKDSHQMYIDGIGNVSPMLKIDCFCIEQLSLKRALEEYGKYHIDDSVEIKTPSEFMGENGVCLLNFTTPIYPWLLSVDNKFDYFYF